MNQDKSWHDALGQAGLGRTPREGIAELRRQERAARQRQHGWKIFLAAIAANQVTGWTLMIAVGVIHGEWWHSVPTVGYHTAVLLTGLAILATAVVGISFGIARGRP